MAASGGELLRKDQRVQRDSHKIRQNGLQLRSLLEPRGSTHSLKMNVHRAYNPACRGYVTVMIKIAIVLSILSGDLFVRRFYNPKAIF